jgi:hypothetical protein
MAATERGPAQPDDPESASAVSLTQSSWAIRTMGASGRLGQIVLALLVVTVAQSFFWADHVPLVLKLGVTAVGCLAFVRPAEALLVVAGVTPLARMFGTRIFTEAFPARVTEAIVLAFLAGWLLRKLRPADGTTPVPIAIRTPALLLGMTVAASCVVHLTVLQVWKDYPWEFAQFFVKYLATGYLTAPIPDPRPWAGILSGYAFIVSAAVMLEGLALLLVVVALAGNDSTLVRRLAHMVVVGAVGAAILSIVQVATIAVASGDTAGMLPQLLNQRWAAFVTKVNTAGSYFVLVLPIALWLAASATPGIRRFTWTGAVLVIGLGLWLSGSRTVLLLVFLMLLAAGVWLARARLPLTVIRRPIGIALVLAFVGVCAILGYRILESTGSAMPESLRFRWLFLETTLKMLATRPMLGIGVGNFLFSSEHFGSEELLTLISRSFGTPRENPHNQFLLVVAELGLIGLFFFGWLLAASLKQLWRAADTPARSPELLGRAIGVGLLACLVTLLANHSLVYAEAAYTFWIVVGLGAVAARPQQPPGPTLEPDCSVWPSHSLVVVATLLIVVGSVPLRAHRERAAIDLSRVSYGFHNWELEGGERRVRWTSRRARFYVRPTVRRVRVPLRALLPHSDWSFTVDISLNGRVVDQVRVENDRWHEVSLELPPRESPRYERVDLRIGPAWHPSDELPGSADRRELGVKVGEIQTFEGD